MNLTLFLAATMAAISGWGFLLAGAVTFYDMERPVIRGVGRILSLIDVFVSFGLITMFFIAAKNWSRKPEGRHLIYKGTTCIAVAAGLGLVSLRIS